MGHELTIYSYEPDELTETDLHGDICDAREVVPESGPIYRYYQAHRFAMFANLFRLELQRQGKGIWVDLDCYMLNQLQPKSDYVFGLMKPGKLNNAVLGLPIHCHMAETYMRAITTVPLRIPWSSFGRRLAREIEILVGYPLPHPSKRTNIGPRALTYFAKRYDLMQYAVPPPIYYPVAARDARILAAADDREAQSKLVHDTVMVHLWRGKLKRLQVLDQPPPRSSYLGQACTKLGIEAF